MIVVLDSVTRREGTVLFELDEIYQYITRCIMVDSGIAAGLAQAPSVAQGDMGLSPHLLPHEIRDK